MEVVRKIALGHDSLVWPAGLEPATSSTPRKRATTCATARRDHYNGNGGTRECGNAKTAIRGHAIRDGRSSRDPLTLYPSPSRERGMRLAATPSHDSGTRECENGETRKDVAERRLLKMGWGRSPRALRPASGSPGNLLWRISGVSWRADSERSGPELSPSPGGRL